MYKKDAKRIYIKLLEIDPQAISQNKQSVIETIMTHLAYGLSDETIIEHILNNLK